MSSYDDRTITVYLKSGSVTHNLGRMKYRTAMRMSPVVRDQITNGGCKEMSDPVGVVFHSPYVDATSMRAVMRWMDGYNTYAKPEGQEITQAHVGSEEFPAVIRVYAAAREMGIAAGIRGNAIRDDILHYIRMSPLTLNEFIMIHECAAFDQYILSSAMNCLINFNMGRNKPPDMGQIMQYCRWAKIHGKMADVKAHIVAKRQERREREVAKGMEGI
ncbi:hypothetical protein M409DRAFT_22166 [Zasmidium cellare ATCC 36951]|uniref:BTB domain-containing protein n=1 Tax=Zasmidium cellare ATCC 36951 TaxID=1080233 RepID=A0A6A6CPG9_ZASCE|nr:uncharacterized protein M409DRAFT_22166 [Zasmidium cellare ATCC 36951]KAF2167356.1 hypothetical protein M409DRAFT_22166 [Zasmidium cellare ATCC 36951]